MTGLEALRVGLLHYTAPPIVGGVEAIVGRQAAGLVRRGCEVVLLAGRGGVPQPGVDIARLPALDSKYPLLLALNKELHRGRVPAAFAALSAEIESALEPILERLDVCVVHNVLTMPFNLPLTAALHRLAPRVRSTLVAWCHDLAWTNPLYQDVLYAGYPWSLLRKPSDRTTYVLVSEDRRQDFAALFGMDPAELWVVPAGVDLGQKWALRPATRRLLAEYDLLAADPFILLPVRITRRKNIELAIRIVAGLRERGRRPRLLVTGPPGPHDPATAQYLDELMALRAELGLESDVILLQVDPPPGGQAWRPSDAMMDDLYRAGDLMLLPSAQEGFGIPILEMGVLGKPIFCSDIPAFREIAGEHARFFGLADPPRVVADRIADFLAEDAEYNLRKRVVRDFEWDSIFDRRVVPLLEAARGRLASAGRDR